MKKQPTIFLVLLLFVLSLLFAGSGTHFFEEQSVNQQLPSVLGASNSFREVGVFDDNYGRFMVSFFLGEFGYLFTEDGNLVIVDITDPANVAVVGTAASDITGVRDIHVDSDFAYVVCGDNGLLIFDVSDPANPQFLNQFISTHPEKTMLGIWVQGNYAFVAQDSAQLRVYDISDKTNPTFISDFIDYVGDGSKIQVYGNYAYLLCAGGYDFKVLNISNINNIQKLDNYGGATGLAFYDFAIEGDYAYILSSPSPFRLRIVDISDKENIALVSNKSFFTAPYEIAVVNDVCYVADGAAGLRIIDVSNKSNPFLNATFPIEQYDSFSLSRIAYTQSNYCFTNNDDYGLLVVDVTDTNNPVLHSSLSQGGSSQDVLVHEDIAYVNDLSGGLELLDISNKNSPTKVTTLFENKTINSMAIHEHYLFVSVLPPMGFYVLDISTPATPVQVGLFNNSFAAPDEYAVSGDDLFFIIASGIIVCNFTNVNEIDNYNAIPTTHATDLAVKGDVLYLLDQIDGLLLYDITDPNAYPWPLLDSYDDGGTYITFNLIDDIVYALDEDAGLAAFDVSNSSAISKIGSYTTIDRSYYDLHVQDKVAYLASSKGFTTLDLSNLSQPTLINDYSLDVSCFGLDFDDGYLYLALGQYNLAIWSSKVVSLGVETIVFQLLAFASLAIVTTWRLLHRRRKHITH